MLMMIIIYYHLQPLLMNNVQNLRQNMEIKIEISWLSPQTIFSATILARSPYKFVIYFSSISTNKSNDI
jgi:hypothetical protein